MATFRTEHLRNVVLLGHSGSGKSMLAEAMLHEAGVTTRLGSIEDGTTVSDYEPEEQRRQSSIQTSILACPWREHKVNIIDTPGYADFRGEAIAGTWVADAAIVVVAGQAGVEVGTKQMWGLADYHRMARFIFISKMDRENADFERAMSSVNEAFGRNCVPIQVPIGAETNFEGSINLTDPDADVPAGMEDEVEEARERLTEAIAESDDDLATKYLEGEPLTQEELTRGLKAGVLSGEIVPVLVGASPSQISTRDVLDAVIDLLPSAPEASPAAATDADGNSHSLTSDSTGPLAALVFKTSADPFVGKLSYFKVFSGVFKADSQVWNASRGEAERIGQVFTLLGKSQEAASELASGDIGAVAKLSATTSGDSLCLRESPLTLTRPAYPNPVFEMAVFPKSKADVDKLSSAIARISEEDPSLSVTRQPDTLEMILGGLGDTHVDVAVEKVQRKFGVEILLQTPKVPYKETISATSRVEYRHKKQSGGHGQFAHVYLELEPMERGAGFTFDDHVVGGNVPREYIPSVQKGVEKAMVDGTLAGFPIVDFKATLYDGSSHPVDSSGVSFEIAGSHALSKGVEAASPILLEPIMKAAITAPDSDTGDIMGDLNSKRARILGMNPNGDGTTTVDVEVPQAEMLRYATDLRSQTQGQGSFTIEFDHYDPVPGHLTQRVVEALAEAEASRA